MPRRNSTPFNAAAANAVTDPASPPSDQAREQSRTVHREPNRYAAARVEDSTLAPPAAGEIAEYMDEGEALAVPGLQMGRNKTARPARTEAARRRGPRTLAALSHDRRHPEG